MRDLVEETIGQLRSLGVLGEGAVTSDYIENDVRSALKAAHIDRADISVEQTGDTIRVEIRCRNAPALKEAGENVVKHLESEEVPARNISYQEVGDGLWEFAFDAAVVAPVH